MPSYYNLKRKFYAIIGGLIGAIYGYVFGIEINLIILAIYNPFASPTIIATATRGAVPLLFALLLGAGCALGVFVEYSVTSYSR